MQVYKTENVRQQSNFYKYSLLSTEFGPECTCQFNSKCPVEILWKEQYSTDNLILPKTQAANVCFLYFGAVDYNIKYQTGENERKGV